jgi:hypothetical protein
VFRKELQAQHSGFLPEVRVVKLRKFAGFFLAALLLGLPGAQAKGQESNRQSNSPSDNPSEPTAPLPPDTPNGAAGSEMPAPAARGPFSSGSNDRGSAQAQPDTHVLSSAEMLGVGSLRTSRSMFDPAFRVIQSADTGIVPGNIDSVSSLGGGFVLDQQWTRFRFVTQYYGAEALYHPDSFYNQAYHNLSLSQTITSGRWVIRLRDDLLISPQATFGGFESPGATQAAALATVAPLFEPGQTILTARTPRLDNTSLGEVEYSLSRRTTVTFSGSYGLLHFLKAGYINSDDIQGRAGYNYALTAKNSIGVTYNYFVTRFTDVNGQIRSHLTQIAFGRKVTGRFALQLAAGPQLFRFHNLGPSNAERLGWSFTGSLVYQTRRFGYTLSYYHEITTGSGVLFGAKTDGISSSISHSFTRSWSGSINSGYGHNQNLVVDSASSFNYWYAATILNRQIGRDFRLALNYGFQRQNNTGSCPVLSCGLGTSRNIAGFTLEWHPLGIRTE